MALVYSYVRMSTKKQEQGDSLRRQVELSDQWIRRNGHTLAQKELHDIGRSGYHGRNLKSPDGKLKEFLSMIQSGTVKPGDILLVECLDRLSRQAMRDAKRVFEEILDSGVLIAVLRPNERLFTRESISDPFGLMEPLMAFHLAHQESKNKSDRIKAVREHQRSLAVKSGSKLDSHCPNWLDWDAKAKAFKVNGGSKAIQAIFELTAHGMGQKQVLAELVTAFEPLGRSGRWNSSYIQKVLSDRSVLGIRQPMTKDETGKRVPIGPEIQGYYPRIIDDSLWYRAQATKEKNKKQKGPNGDYVNLFTGLTINAKDGSVMQVQTTRYRGTAQRRLTSYAAKCKEKNACHVTVMLDDFERHILKQIDEIRIEDLSRPDGSELTTSQQELEGIEQRLQRMETELVEAKGEDFTFIRNAASQLRKRRDDLRKTVCQLTVDAAAEKPIGKAKELLKLLETATGDELRVIRQRLRILIREIVETIHILPEKHFGRVHVLVQVTYRDGQVRQFGYGPNWKTNHSGKSHDQCDWDLSFDLRNKVDCQKPRLGKLAAMFIQAEKAPKDRTIPDRLDHAAELFLRIRRSELPYESFKTIPAKIRRFVDFIGADTKVKTLSERDLGQYGKWLAASDLTPSTQRVASNRVKEFWSWLGR